MRIITEQILNRDSNEYYRLELFCKMLNRDSKNNNEYIIKDIFMSDPDSLWTTIVDNTNNNQHLLTLILWKDIVNDERSLEDIENDFFLDYEFDEKILNEEDYNVLNTLLSVLDLSEEEFLQSKNYKIRVNSKGNTLNGQIMCKTYIPEDIIFSYTINSDTIKFNGEQKSIQFFKDFIFLHKLDNRTRRSYASNIKYQDILINDADVDVLCELAANKDLKYEYKMILATSKTTTSPKISLLEHEDLEPEFMEAMMTLSSLHNGYLLNDILAHVNCPEHFLLKYSQADDDEYLLSSICNSKKQLSERVLLNLINTGNANITIDVIRQRPECNENVLMAIAKKYENNRPVKVFAINHPSCPVEAIKLMAKTTDLTVLFTARKRLKEISMNESK